MDKEKLKRLEMVNDIIKVLSSELSDKKVEKRRLEEDLYFEATGIKVGSIVQDKTGKKFKVSKFQFIRLTGVPNACMYGNKIKKDGNPSMNARYIGEAKLVKEGENV